MSCVTNVILKTAVNEEKGITALNALFESRFMSCDDKFVRPPGWYAGSKMLECEIYPGAFNFLKLDDLVAAIQNVTWRNPKAVQLFIQEQDECRFHEVILNV